MANDKLILYRSNGGSSGSLMDGYPPENVSSFVAEPKNASVALTWIDPEDLPLVGNMQVKWKYTRIVRKTGSYPANENDGTVVVDSGVRNQYSGTPYIDTNLTNNVTYYYAEFACSEDGVYNHENVTASATPVSCRIMSVVINRGDTNPKTCCSYTDDAVGMQSGQGVTEWAEFFGYRPCLLKDGQVVGYLKPDDFTKFVDGTDADITTGNAGDVMIEFPRRGIKIGKVDTLTTVSMTDNPDDSDFTYYAHSRGSSRKEFFYVGAYMGLVADNKLRSISGVRPIENYTFNNYRTWAHAMGPGYEQVTFYQWTYLQVMYLLQFKRLDSNAALGGFSLAVGLQSTGTTNTKGMMYCEPGQSGYQTKVFGIEDLIGNRGHFVDGFMTDDVLHYHTATDNFNNERSGYTDVGAIGSMTNPSGFFREPIGTSEGAFALYLSGGSLTTYYCTKADVVRGCVLEVGGPGMYMGMFEFICEKTPDQTTSTSARLSYY